MSEADTVTISIPRSAVDAILALSKNVTDRMHELLERNTDGSLGLLERDELEMLVRIAHFHQIVSTAIAGAA